jgi:exonuclease III
MSLLSWNCRGLGNPRSVCDLRWLVKEKKPTFLFLMETRMRNKKLQVLRNKLGFEGMLTMDPIGRGGVLAFLWLNPREVEVLNYSLRHISALIKLEGSDLSWKFTGFYGNPDRNQRDASWKLLRHLSTCYDSFFLKKKHK